MAHQVVDIQCPGCGAPVDTGQKECIYCHRPVVITTFNSVYDMPMPEVNKYANEYRKNLADNPDNQELNTSIAMCYLKLGLYDKAAAAFEKSYGYLKDTEIVKKLYYMTVFCPRLSMKDKYKKNMTEELKGQWDREMEEARQKAMLSEEVRNLEKIFEKDPLKRSSQAASMIHQWKQEYRNMI